MSNLTEKGTYALHIVLMMISIVLSILVPNVSSATDYAKEVLKYKVEYTKIISEKDIIGNAKDKEIKMYYDNLGTLLFNNVLFSNVTISIHHRSVLRASDLNKANELRQTQFPKCKQGDKSENCKLYFDMTKANALQQTQLPKCKQGDKSENCKLYINLAASLNMDIFKDKDDVRLLFSNTSYNTEFVCYPADKICETETGTMTLIPTKYVKDLYSYSYHVGINAFTNLNPFGGRSICTYKDNSPCRIDLLNELLEERARNSFIRIIAPIGEQNQDGTYDSMDELKKFKAVFKNTDFYNSIGQKLSIDL